MRVSNQKILRKITWRSLKSNHFRNLMAIFAICLTAVLFTTVATLGSALIQSAEESTFRQVGTSAHGGFKYLTQEQYDTLAQSPQIKDMDYDIILGFAVNPELREKQHEVRFCGDKKAEWGFSAPTIGHMPRAYREIALSDLTLELLHLPQELGQSVYLEIEVNGTVITDEFTLCGIYEGDAVMWASQVFLSQDYVRDLAPSPEQVDTMQIAGLINADVWLSNSFDVEAKLDDILRSSGYDPAQMFIGVNWAYTTSGTIDATTVVLIALMILIIAASGYLIIYSIFAISVSDDIRFYGLLKTIGTTGRQIKSLVRRQALALSLVGIPLGLLLGFLLGTQLAPVMMQMISYDSPSQIRANPWIFVIAALFSVVTVFVSCNKPGKSAARVSPIEALRYHEVGASQTRARGTRRVTPATMAWANIGRNRRKLATVLLSLSLSLILLNSVVSIVNGFDMDVYLQNQLQSDFYFADAAMYNFAVSPSEKDFQCISEEFVAEAAQQPGVEAYGRVFFWEGEHPIESQERLTRMERIVRPYVTEHYGEANLNDILAREVAYLQIYGLDPLAFAALAENYQSIDWETFASGKYVLMEAFRGESIDEESLYEIGEKILLTAADGSVTEYEVLGYIDYPHAMSSQYSALVGFRLVLPAAEFEALFPEHAAMSLLVDVAPDAQEDVEAWASELTSTRMTQLTYRSRAFYVAEFRALQSTFLILGGVLSFILALIGILNFINTMATSIMTRKRELAMLQSVGMTGTQLKQMLFGEGLCYAGLTLLFALTFGTAISALVTHAVAREIWFFRYHFSVQPILICTPILLLLCAVIPLLCARTLQKEPIVVRLREN